MHPHRKKIFEVGGLDVPKVQDICWWALKGNLGERSEPLKNREKERAKNINEHGGSKSQKGRVNRYTRGGGVLIRKKKRIWNKGHRATSTP